MAGEKPDVLLVGAKKPVLMKGFEGKVTLHHWLDAKDKATFVKEVGNKIKAIAIARNTSWKRLMSVSTRCRSRPRA